MDSSHPGAAVPSGQVRDLSPSDIDRVVEFGLRAWAPVFLSVKSVIGVEMFNHFYGQDWCITQAREIRRSCSMLPSWIWEALGRPAGFIGRQGSRVCRCRAAG
jgi:hypothetical protein